MRLVFLCARRRKKVRSSCRPFRQMGSRRIEAASGGRVPTLSMGRKPRLLTTSSRPSSRLSAKR